MNKKLLQNIIREELKKHLQEADYADKWKIVGTLITDTTLRPQQEILSDIRSLTGVTVVSTVDLDDSYAQQNPNLRTQMTVKIDGYPFIRHGGFGRDSLKSIIAAIKKVKGVKTFIANPENIKRL